jgi:hypothetical protein
MYFRILALLVAFILPAQSVQAQGGLFSFLTPRAEATERKLERGERQAARKDARADRQAARKAARAERQAARKAGRIDPALVGTNGRQELKQRVQVAMMNRPAGRLWCVPFARTVTGVTLRGNAKTWWQGAKGKYARGASPKVGAIMSFAASRAMPQGHVGVVSKVISPREVWLDHANWERIRITLDQLAVDVSPQNDWSKVRVQHSSGAMGRVNPVNGFIYN